MKKGTIVFSENTSIVSDIFTVKRTAGEMELFETAQTKRHGIEFIAYNLPGEITTAKMCAIANGRLTVIHLN